MSSESACRPISGWSNSISGHHLHGGVQERVGEPGGEAEPLRGGLGTRVQPVEREVEARQRPDPHRPVLSLHVLRRRVLDEVLVHRLAVGATRRQAVEQVSEELLSAVRKQTQE